MTSQPLYLHASGLFSKWGFGDGDCVWDWLYDVADPAAADGIDEHRVLEQLVRDCLLPVIAAAGHTVELEFIETIHNPVRARRVDGEIVPDDVIYGGDAPAWAEDISVAITLDQLVLAPA